jgi:hypothetical protein
MLKTAVKNNFIYINGKKMDKGGVKISCTGNKYLYL